MVKVLRHRKHCLETVWVIRRAVRAEILDFKIRKKRETKQRQTEQKDLGIWMA